MKGKINMKNYWNVKTYAKVLEKTNTKKCFI